MKFIIITCFLALTAECLGVGLSPSKFQLDEQSQKTLVSLVSRILPGSNQQRLSYPIINTEDDDAEARATLFPPQPDPLELDDLFIFPEDFDLTDYLAGSVNFTELVVTGASTLVHDLSLVLVSTKLTFTLSVPSITLKGVHDTHISDISGLYILTGQDKFELNIVNLATKIEVSLLVNAVTDRVRITNFALTLDYEDFSMNFGATEFNGTPLDWAIITADIKSCYDFYWDSVDEVITNFFLNDINALLEDCSLTDELLNGNLECLFTSVEVAKIRTSHKIRALRAACSPTLTTTEGIENTTLADNGVSKMVQMYSLFLVLPLTYGILA